MSEMVERLFPILVEATRGFSCGSMDYEGTLRRLIAAMREPTEAMCDVVHDGDFDIYWEYRADGRPGGPDDVYRAMIDAALRE